MKHRALLAGFSLAAFASLTQAGSAAPDVVATIKPIHSLVASVMQGVGEPVLLVKGGASPHAYSLKPSDAGALEAADLVFWTGAGMELFLDDALESLAGKARVVEMAKTPGLVTYPMREGDAFEAHSHEDDHGHDDHGHDDHGDEHGHEHGNEDEHDHAHDGHSHSDEHDHGQGAVDMHFWLDPENAKLMVEAIADELAAADPENAQAYKANAREEVAALDALRSEIDDLLAPVKQRPFIVFHDAFQYFEKRFGLTIAGSITVSPEVMPGAQRLIELRQKVAELGATCVFAEPQFRPSIVSSIVEGTKARTGILDPEAGELAQGPELYSQLLREMAGAIVQCLE